MTVGLYFTNGLEAIVITDSRVSGSGRQSDSVDKMGEFSHDNYSGVIFGTGDGNILLGVFDYLGDISTDSLDKFVKSVHDKYRVKINHSDNQFLEKEKLEVEKKSILIPGRKERNKFVQQMKSDILNKYDRFKHDPSSQTPLMLVANDESKGKVRMFYMTFDGVDELFSSHVEIGSGRDGSNIYLGTKLQGVDAKILASHELAFFAANAYCNSTINQGVGGLPKIAKLSREGVEILPTEKSVALINLSGAYLAGFNHDKLSPESTIGLFNAIINYKRPPYSRVAKILDIKESTLITAYIQYSSWQERANKKLFNRNKSNTKKK